MSRCDITRPTGFITIQGPITTTHITQPRRNGIMATTFPFSIAFASNSATSFNNNKIHYDNLNTFKYRSTTYTLIDMQICASLHTGYALPQRQNKVPSAELILTFSGSDVYDAILMCVPIFDGGNSDNNKYLQQIINQSPDSQKASLDSVFLGQPSFAYSTCFETVNAQNVISSHNLYAIIFPNGIELSQQDFTKMKTSVKDATSGNFINYTIPATIRNWESTIVNSQKYANGYLPSTPIETCNPDFINKFEYFKNGPVKLSSTAGSTSSSKTMNLDKYKCMPFNAATMSTDGTLTVIQNDGNPTLKKIVDDQTNKNNSPAKSKTEILEIAIGSIGALVLVVVGGIILYKSKE